MNRTTLAISAVLIVTGCATTPDCDRETGFETGLAGHALHAACSNEDYLEAHRIGLTLAQMYHEREELLAEEDNLGATGRARLRVLERDIPEMETLARMQGLLPPSPPPRQGSNQR